MILAAICGTVEFDFDWRVTLTAAALRIVFKHRIDEVRMASYLDSIVSPRTTLPVLVLIGCSLFLAACDDPILRASYLHSADWTAESEYVLTETGAQNVEILRTSFQAMPGEDMFFLETLWTSDDGANGRALWAHHAVPSKHNGYLEVITTYTLQYMNGELFVRSVTSHDDILNLAAIPE